MAYHGMAYIVMAVPAEHSAVWRTMSSVGVIGLTEAVAVHEAPFSHAQL